jgi:endoglucanase
VTPPRLSRWHISGALVALAAGALTCAKDPPSLPDYLTGSGGTTGVACASGTLLRAPGSAGIDGDAGGGAGLVAGSGMAGGPGAAGAGGPGGGAGSRGPVVPVGPTPWLHVQGNQIKDPGGHLVILRGVAFPDLGELELTEGGIDAMIDRVTSPAEPAGGCSPSWEARAIRVAVSPPDGDAHTPKQYLPGSDYYDTILRPTVDYARAKGLYVIIDWHYIDDTTKHQATTSQFWTEMAPHFAGDPNVLFELYNEPINSGSWPSVKADMQIWHDIVRAAAPDNLILIGSPNWDQLVGAATANPIAGTNLVYVAHMYPEHWKNVQLRAQIGNAAKLFPIAITEWGFETAGNSTISGTIDTYGAPFKQFVRELNLSWTAWCASGSWRPAMFNPDMSLRVANGAMGGFVKDWLYEDHLLDQPVAP